jgi:hypothetical protein
MLIPPVVRGTITLLLLTIGSKGCMGVACFESTNWVRVPKVTLVDGQFLSHIDKLHTAANSYTTLRYILLGRPHHWPIISSPARRK